MAHLLKKSLASSLCLAVLLPSFASAGQIVSAPVQVPAGALGAGVAAAGVRSPVTAPLQAPSLLSVPTLRPTLSPSLTPSIAAPAAAPAVVQAAAHPMAIAAAPMAVLPSAVAAAAAPQARSPEFAATVGTLERTVQKGTPAGSYAVRLGTLFDGVKGRTGAALDAPAVAARSFEARPSALGRAPISAPRSGVTPAPAPRPSAARRSIGVLAIAAVAAAAFFAAPAIALAAPAVAAGGVSASVIAAIHPAASMLASVAGAIYGLIVARKQGGPEPSAGAVLASMLRYGMLAGAGVYILGDLSQVIFLGSGAAGLTPLPLAVATAALGQSAFQGTFSEAATTPADRLMAAFPAVAGALGLSTGFFFAPQGLLFTALVGAMSATGVAGAVYAAVFKPGTSAAAGPSSMARGYVLQALMSGLALAVTSPWLIAPFVALAAWGFWDVLSTSARAVLAALGYGGASKA